MTIAIGSDHAGFALRNKIQEIAEEEGFDVVVLGAESNDSYDYPLAADLVAQSIIAGKTSWGVLICGTGIGVSIRANRYQAIRAAVCCSPETAQLAREHNHANILCLGARTTELANAERIFLAFAQTAGSTEERHLRRIDLLDADV